ncbi:hypothetical protein HI914_05730 [Erysiphe necator]|nr:hypothetical protein HI914_05730 [Erysiphe necator]
MDPTSSLWTYNHRVLHHSLSKLQQTHEPHPHCWQQIGTVFKFPGTNYLIDIFKIVLTQSCYRSNGYSNNTGDYGSCTPGHYRGRWFQNIWLFN